MAKIYYARVDEFWRKEQKYDFLEQEAHGGNVAWQMITPDRKHNWLTEGMSASFEQYTPIGIRGSKAIKTGTIFSNFSLGVNTARDAVVYDFDPESLCKRIKQFCKDYNSEVSRYLQNNNPGNIDHFVNYQKVKWSSTLKQHLKRGTVVQFDQSRLRRAQYRPFTRIFLYYDFVLNDRPALFSYIFPNSVAKNENRLICVPGIGNRKDFGCLTTNFIPSLDLAFEKTQCFPFYTYDENSSNRRENITDWALEQFRARYPSPQPSPKGRGAGGEGYYQMGHLPLRLRLTPSSHLPHHLRRQPAPRTAPHSLCQCRGAPSRNSHQL